MKQCQECKGHFMIRIGNVCRGCEKKKKETTRNMIRDNCSKTKQNSIVRMFENLTITHSPRIRRAAFSSKNRRAHAISFGKEEEKHESRKNEENVPSKDEEVKKEKSSLLDNLSKESKEVKKRIETIETEIERMKNESMTIPFPEGALSFSQYEDALKKGEISKYRGKSTPKEKYDDGWVYSIKRRKWIKVKAQDIAFRRQEQLEGMLRAQSTLISLTKRQAEILSKLRTLSSAIEEETKTQKLLSITSSDVLLVFDTNCFLHLDGPNTILQCAIEIAKNPAMKNVSIMIPREINNELDRLKTPRFREWRCRRCFLLVHGKTTCIRCGMSMPFEARQDSEKRAWRARQGVRCVSKLRMKRMYSTSLDIRVSVNQQTLYRDRGHNKNPERLRGDKSILNGILSFTRGPRKCRCILISSDASFRNLASSYNIDVFCEKDIRRGLHPEDLKRLWNVVKLLQQEF